MFLHAPPVAADAKISDAGFLYSEELCYGNLGSGILIIFVRYLGYQRMFGVLSILQ